MHFWLTNLSDKLQKLLMKLKYGLWFSILYFPESIQQKKKSVWMFYHGPFNLFLSLTLRQFAISLSIFLDSSLHSQSRFLHINFIFFASAESSWDFPFLGSGQFVSTMKIM